MSIQDIHQSDAFKNVHEAIEAVKSGDMVIMIDDEDRENEGDIVFAAEFVNAEKINFLAKEARGLICLAMEDEFIQRLELPMMKNDKQSMPARSTAFTVSIEARQGVTTGISAADRAQTIKVATDESTKPSDLVVPGHIFPLRACKGGVLERAGHTEGSVDLMLMSGLKSAAVICEVMNDDGSMARLPDLEAFARKFSMPIITIADLIEYSLQRKSLIEQRFHKKVEFKGHQLDMYAFESIVDGCVHLAISKGSTHEGPSPMFGDHTVDVRVHPQQTYQDFMEMLSSGESRLEKSFNLLSTSEHSAIVYLCSASKDSFSKELEAIFGTADSQPAKQMDMRLYGVGAQILKTIGVKKMRVHTSKPKTLKGLSGFGLEIVEQTNL